jgi:hypothetical protein
MTTKISSQLFPRLTQIFAIASLTALTTIPVISQPSYAGDTTFYCDTQNGKYFTFAKTEDRSKSQIIGWTSTDFPPPYNPKYRCQVVSERFQRNYDNGTLKVISTGIVNRQPVICSGSSSTTVCNSSNLLFTLKSGANRKAVANRLFNDGALAAGKIPDFNSNSEDIMFNFDIYLNNLQGE